MSGKFDPNQFVKAMRLVQEQVTIKLMQRQLEKQEFILEDTQTRTDNALPPLDDNATLAEIKTRMLAARNEPIAPSFRSTQQSSYGTIITTVVTSGKVEPNQFAKAMRLVEEEQVSIKLMQEQLEKQEVILEDAQTRANNALPPLDDNATLAEIKTRMLATRNEPIAPSFRSPHQSSYGTTIPRVANQVSGTSNQTPIISSQIPMSGCVLQKSKPQTTAVAHLKVERPPNQFKELERSKYGTPSWYASLSHYLLQAVVNDKQRVESIRPQVEGIERTEEGLACVSFSDFDMVSKEKNHLKPLFVIAHVNGVQVKRVIIDSGSLYNVLSLKMLKKLGYTVDQLSPTLKQIHGFNNMPQAILGTICIDIDIEELSTLVEFSVIDSRTFFNMLLGRRWIHENKIIPSSYYQCFKYLKDGIVRKVDGDQNPFTQSEVERVDIRETIKATKVEEDRIKSVASPSGAMLKTPAKRQPESNPEPPIPVLFKKTKAAHEPLPVDVEKKLASAPISTIMPPKESQQSRSVLPPKVKETHIEDDQRPSMSIRPTTSRPSTPQLAKPPPSPTIHAPATALRPTSSAAGSCGLSATPMAHRVIPEMAAKGTGLIKFSEMVSDANRAFVDVMLTTLKRHLEMARKNGTGIGSNTAGVIRRTIDLVRSHEAPTEELEGFLESWLDAVSIYNQVTAGSSVKGSFLPQQFLMRELENKEASTRNLQENLMKKITLSRDIMRCCPAEQLVIEGERIARLEAELRVSRINRKKHKSIVDSETVKIAKAAVQLAAMNKKTEDLRTERRLLEANTDFRVTKSSTRVTNIVSAATRIIKQIDDFFDTGYLDSFAPPQP